MKPFVLEQHDKDSAAVRDLLDTEIANVSGGVASPLGVKAPPHLTVTPNGDGGIDQ